MEENNLAKFRLVQIFNTPYGFKVAMYRDKIQKKHKNDNIHNSKV